MPSSASWLVGTVAAVAVAGVVVVALGRLLRRVLRTRPALVELLRRTRLPAVAVASTGLVRARLEEPPFSGDAAEAARQAATVAVIASVAWLATRGLVVLEQAVLGRFDVTHRDNLRARSLRTQVLVLRRVCVVVVVVLAGVAVLRTFPWGRDVGTSLLAASGIIGVVAGVSGRSTIGNLIAGIQIAFAEPIRLDDVVVVEDEWGNIEEITLTYVVVRVWDQRRLVLPTSWFVENPFQNWTREHADITGVVQLWVDYSVPVDAMRAELDRIVTSSELWDGRVVVLQVIDSSPHALLVRALVSATDGPTAWNLRCEVREALVAWLVANHPEALPRLRTADAARDAGDGGASGGGDGNHTITPGHAGGATDRPRYVPLGKDPGVTAE